MAWGGRNLKYHLIPPLSMAGTAGTDQDAQSFTQPALGPSGHGDFKSKEFIDKSIELISVPQHFQPKPLVNFSFTWEFKGNTWVSKIIFLLSYRIET